jgi:tetratricopeptide (TPR) repeat protein
MVDLLRLLKLLPCILTVAWQLTPAAECQITGQSQSEYGRAEGLVRAHQWDQGLALLEPELKRNPHSLKALNLAGLACTGKGDLKRANEYFHRALAVDPAFVPALKNLGINEFSLHDLASAEKYLQVALKSEPGDPVLNLYLGQIAYTRQDFKSAANCLKKAEAFVSRSDELKAHLSVSLLQTGQTADALVLIDEFQPGALDSASQFAIGLSLAQADLPDRAIPFFELVRQSHPESYDVAFNLVVCYIGTRKYSDAIALANPWISADHDTSELENAIADSYEHTKDTPRAISALRRAIELDPESDDNYLDFANLCIDHRDFENGLKVIDVGLKVHPNSYRLVFERGVLYAMEDQFDRAEQDFEQSSRLAPATNFGYVGIGVTYLETGNAAKAIDLLHERLKQEPNDASLLYLLGEALMRNGAQPGSPQYREAQSSLERAVHLNSSLCLPHVALGEIYIDEERFKDAVVQLEQARAIDPKEKSAYSHLAVAYRKLGDPDSARRILGMLKDVHGQEQGWVHSRMKSGGDDPPKAATN